MSENFSLCELNGQKSIRYHQEFGDFDFLLVQADDGSNNIDFYCSVPISKQAKKTIGNAAIRLLQKTGGTLNYEIKGDTPNFNDAMNILTMAFKYVQQQKINAVKPQNKK